MKRNVILAIAAATTLAATTAAEAATPAEWESFRRSVADACIDAGRDLFKSVSIAIDPFGSKSYGLALMTGEAKAVDPSPISVICVYDKQSKTAEIGGALPEAVEVPGE